MLQRLRTVEILKEHAGLEVVQSGATVGSLLTWMRGQDRSNWPHLLVIELLSPDGAASDEAAVAALREAGMRVLMVSSLIPRHAARRVIGAGVEGVVSKLDSEQVLLECVAAVLAGESAVTALAQQTLADHPRVPRFSAQESKVFELYVAGNRIAEVAAAIGVREDTARKYLTRVKQKYAALGRAASTKLDLARLAREDGLFE